MDVGGPSWCGFPGAGAGAPGSSAPQERSLRSFYVAVSAADAKLPTLVQLLEALRAGAKLAVAVAVSSRDAVDAVAAALAVCQGFNIAVLHSDLELHEMEQQVLQLKRKLQLPPAEDLQQAGACPTDAQRARGAAQPPGAGGGNPAAAAAAAASRAGAEASHEAWTDERSLALVTSDVCLKALHRDLLPLSLPLLIQYDTPTSKDVLQRRLAAVFGSSKERARRAGQRLVVIDFVVAGELAAFRARERLSSTPVLEMPVHVPDIFA